jgi:hypothetical protein
MGYNVQIKHSTAVIPAEHKDEVLQIWKDLNKPENNHLKRGGSWSKGEQNVWWYSWMPSNYDLTVTSVEDVLNELGFETELDHEGNVLICEYDSKRGQESLFFNRVAHLIKGQIMWEGEDGSTWVWELGKKFAIDYDG